MTDLIARLRGLYPVGKGDPPEFGLRQFPTVQIQVEAADALEAQAQRITDLDERLTDAIAKHGDAARKLGEAGRERDAAAKRAEYWKAEHLAGNAEIDALRAERDEAVALLREAAPHVGRGPVTKELRRRIDDFLAADSATHRETPVT